MIELKCKNCGGNQFRHNKEMNDIIECSYCGTHYEKSPKEIKEEVPLGLKIKIKSDMSTLHVNNCIIHGDMNHIVGNYNIIKGDMNNIRGKGNVVEGDMNTSH